MSQPLFGHNAKLFGKLDLATRMQPQLLMEETSRKRLASDHASTGESEGKREEGDDNPVSGSQQVNI